MDDTYMKLKQCRLNYTKVCWSRGAELNHRQPGFCMPDMLFFGQPSKANNYSRKLYQAELPRDSFITYETLLKQSDVEIT